MSAFLRLVSAQIFSPNHHALIIQWLPNSNDGQRHKKQKNGKMGMFFRQKAKNRGKWKSKQSASVKKFQHDRRQSE